MPTGTVIGTGKGRRDPDAAMRAKWWATIKSGAITEARSYEVASARVGRPLQPGFGLTACTHRELILCLDAQQAEISGRPLRGNSRTAEHSNRRTPSPLLGDGSVRVSLAQTRLERNLIEELRLSEAEVAGIFQRATGQYFTSRMGDHSKFIAALQSIKRRRLRQAPGGLQGSRSEVQR